MLIKVFDKWVSRDLLATKIQGIEVDMNDKNCIMVCLLVPNGHDFLYFYNTTIDEVAAEINKQLKAEFKMTEIEILKKEKLITAT